MSIQLRYPFQTIQPVTGTFGDGHHGIDFGAIIGTPALDSFDGRVMFAGVDNTGFGNLVKIDCGAFYLLYGHLSAINTQVGAWVRCGQIVGYTGNTGNSTGPHMHFEMRMKGLDNGMYGAVDPMPYLVYPDIDEMASISIENETDTEETGLVRISSDDDWLNLRDAPDTIAGNILTRIPNGIMVRYIGKVKVDTDIWLKLSEGIYCAERVDGYQYVDLI
jgi:hypothetical protein